MGFTSMARDSPVAAPAYSLRVTPMTRADDDGQVLCRTGAVSAANGCGKGEGVMPRVVIPILVGLFAGVLFVASNVTAQHDPQPHDVPIAVSGEPATALQAKLGPQYAVTGYA